MVRDSAWRIVWNPAGESPVVLLDYGDLLTAELAGSISQAVDIGRFDFAVSGQPRGRANRRRRLVISRLREFPDILAAWQAMIAATRDDLWGKKSLLSVTPYAGGPKIFRAAFLSVDRSPLNGNPHPAFVHRQTLRIDAGMQPSGPGEIISGGSYNPPVEGGGSNSGGIVVTVPPGSPINPGDWVNVVGVPGVPNGTYQVGSKTPGGGIGGGDRLGIKAPSDERPRDDAAGVIGGSASGYVTRTYPGSTIKISGIGDTATYQWSINGGALTGVTPDAFGRAEINLGALGSTISYAGWYTTTPTINPLPLTGETVQGVTETGPTKWHVRLYRNGVLEDEMEIAPSWSTQKTFSPGGNANHTLSASGGATFTLHGRQHGMAQRPRLDPGVSAQIPAGGTVTRVS